MADPRVELLYLTVLGVKIPPPRAVKVWFSRRETERFHDLRPFVAVPVGVLVAVCNTLKKVTKLAKVLAKYVDVVVSAACVALNASSAADLAYNLDQAHRRRNCLTLEIGVPKVFDFNDGRGKYCKP